jgi:IMP dehydrogenase
MANEALDTFFASRAGIALTYDDVRMHTDYSELLPNDVSLRSWFSRNVPLRIPVIGSPMDTVTEAAMAIALASKGGIGVIHRNLTPGDQAKQVAAVKQHLHALIEKPVTVHPKDSVKDVLARREEKGYRFHSFPVVDGTLVGVITRNDFDLAPDKNQTVETLMTPLARLVTAPKGTDPSAALARMREQKVKILPIVTEKGELAGLYVHSDVERVLSDTSMHNVDANGHLRVAGAVGVGEPAYVRAAALAEKGCDIFVIDTAHGYSRNVLNTLKELKARFPSIDVVAGNVSRGKAALALAEAGADGILVGQGPGSICTTRIVAGIGCPQVTALYDCVKALADAGYAIPVCADGGIRNPGDIVIALAVGAQSVMLGLVLAGTVEAAGEVRTVKGVTMKEYRGMGSIAAMQSSAASRQRYRQTDVSLSKLVPEGIEAVVPLKGSVLDLLDQYMGSVRSGFAYVGAATLPVLAERAELFQVSAAGLAESHPHDVVMTSQPSNYVGR